MRKHATTISLCLLALGAALGFAPRAARAAPTIVTLSSTQGVLGSFVILYGSDFGNAQGQSYVMYGDSVVLAAAWSDIAVTVHLVPGARGAPLATGGAHSLVIVKEPG